MTDWIKALSGYSRQQISAACEAWVSSQKWRPAPSEIVELIKSQRGQGQSRMSNLTASEAATVSKILANARAHIRTFPAGTPLHEAGKSTVDYWEGQA